MKALHVIDSLGRGGAEQVLVTLLPELVRQGCVAKVAVLRPPYDLQQALEERGIHVHRLQRRHKWNVLGASREIAGLVREADFGVVHAHLYFPAISVALTRLLGLHGAKTFVSFHNLAYAGATRDSIGLRVKRRFAAYLYPRGYDGLLAVSRAVADHYRAALGLDYLAVLPNPVEVPANVHAEPSVHGGLKIVIPGRLVQEKGHTDLIQALTLLKQPCSVVFAGGGPLHEALQKAGPHVQITGPLEHDEMLRWIASADIVVIPSRFEGFGLAALEAMSLSKPVVATRAGGLPDVLGDAGLLVPPSNPVALANAIQTLVDDPALRASLGNAARIRATRDFSPNAIAAQLLALYHQYPKERAE
ncbi:glycosyltransferase family 4 protein [Thalassovita sp.]|uniref:glycosyltransferase family 4 protein n=1 Tax=Thalassovita sp. TaxID=1979401 RepID=UPI0029DE642C|nr:glycosyltransferase family 4 protein [Thalassovita sp.]